MPHELIAKTFEPIWYDHDDGWIGQTYLQGMQFCTDQSSDDGKRHICPLSGWLFFCSAFLFLYCEQLFTFHHDSALCPLGKVTKPTGGVKKGELQRAVQVSPQIHVLLTII
jgi:hypothetical protein